MALQPENPNAIEITSQKRQICRFFRSLQPENPNAIEITLKPGDRIDIRIQVEPDGTAKVELRPTPEPGAPPDEPPRGPHACYNLADQP